jgi:1-acyl-sn-glycerol-3-phosphate acyltransferase
MRRLRSFLYNAIMMPSALLYAAVSLLTFPLPFYARYRFMCGWARMQMWLLRWLCGMKYRVEGRGHLPKGAAIILSKHQSTWETIAFQAIFPPQTWVLKRELMWIPFFGWALALLKPIAIDRGAGRRAVEQVAVQGTARLKEGIWVVVFPEGTRVAPGQRRRYGIGGAALAAASGYPVVPVAHNAGSFWPRRGFLKRPGTVQVVIGPVIEADGKSPEQILRAAEHWIEGEMPRLESRAASGKE